MIAPSSERIHASCVSIDGRAVLLVGASGAGKSDLALRLIDRGARLVSDDYTIVTRQDDHAIANAPTTIADRIEIWGVGIVDMQSVNSAPVELVILLDEPPQRMPEPLTRLVAGVAVRALALRPFEASTPIKIELALREQAL